MLNFCVPFSGRIVAVTETLRPTGSSAFTHATADNSARGGFVLGTGGIGEAAAAAASSCCSHELHTPFNRTGAGKFPSRLR